MKKPTMQEAAQTIRDLIAEKNTIADLDAGVTSLLKMFFVNYCKTTDDLRLHEELRTALQQKRAMLKQTSKEARSVGDYCH